jgi:glycine cleavage system H protein
MRDIPQDLKYTQEHEWARVVEENLLRIGITAHAAEQLGDITMVELPREGDEVDQDDEFGTIESVKAVSAVYAPVAGVIEKVNEVLEDNPEYINEDPYDEGWLVEIKMSEPAQVSALMDAAAYEQFIAEQED